MYEYYFLFCFLILGVLEKFRLQVFDFFLRFLCTKKSSSKIMVAVLYFHRRAKGTVFGCFLGQSIFKSKLGNMQTLNVILLAVLHFIPRGMLYS